MPNRPMTQQELKREKAKEQSTPNVTVYNCGKALIPLHIRKPGTDFYVGEHVVRLGVGQSYTDKEEMFNMSQLDNLKSKGLLRFSIDS